MIVRFRARLLITLALSYPAIPVAAASFDMADARQRLETCVAGPLGLRLSSPREEKLDEAHRMILAKLRVLGVLGDRANASDMNLMGVVFGGFVHNWLNHLPSRETLAMYHDDPARAPVDCLYGIMRDALDAAPITAAERRGFLNGVSKTLLVTHGASTPARLLLKFGLGARYPALGQAFDAEDPVLVRTANQDFRDRLHAECERLMLR